MARVEVHKVALMTGHKDCIYSLTDHPGSSKFFSAAADGMVVEWDLATPDLGNLIAKVPNSVYSTCFLAGEGLLLVGQNFDGLHLIDVQEKKELKSLKLTDSYIFDIKVSEDKIFITTGKGELIVVIKDSFTILDKVHLSSKNARTIEFHPFLNLCAIGLSDHTVKVFDWKKNKIMYEIFGHQNSIFTTAFSPDGQYLITGSRDATIKIWNCKEDFKLHKSIVAHMFAVNHVVYNAAGTLFATCSMDKSVKVWDAAEFKLLKVIDKARHAGHGTSVNKLLWKDHLLISASDDRTISVWDLKFI